MLPPPPAARGVRGRPGPWAPGCLLMPTGLGPDGAFGSAEGLRFRRVARRGRSRSGRDTATRDTPARGAAGHTSGFRPGPRRALRPQKGTAPVRRRVRGPLEFALPQRPLVGSRCLGGTRHRLAGGTGQRRGRRRSSDRAPVVSAGENERWTLQLSGSRAPVDKPAAQHPGCRPPRPTRPQGLRTQLVRLRTLARGLRHRAVPLCGCSDIDDHQRTLPER